MGTYKENKGVTEYSTVKNINEMVESSMWWSKEWVKDWM